MLTGKLLENEVLSGELQKEYMGGGGTTDYPELNDLPQINGVELVGNRSLAQLGIQPAGDYATNTSLNEDVAKLVDEKADKAMYYVKANGKNNYSFAENI